MKSTGTLCLWNSWNRPWTIKKIICIEVVCIMTICNPENDYQQLGITSSSFLWNTGMHLPNYMAPHHQAYSKTMNKSGWMASSMGVYTACTVHTFIYVYNALLYVQCVHIWGMHGYKIAPLVGPQNKYSPFKAWWLLYVLPVLTFQSLHSAHSVSTCLYSSQNKQLFIYLHNIIRWLVFVTRCLVCGAKWVFK
jgi:hypothetical protein